MTISVFQIQRLTAMAIIETFWQKTSVASI